MTKYTEQFKRSVAQQYLSGPAGFKPSPIGMGWGIRWCGDGLPGIGPMAAMKWPVSVKMRPHA
jgi:hypothetical protein